MCMQKHAGGGHWGLSDGIEFHIGISGYFQSIQKLKPDWGVIQVGSENVVWKTELAILSDTSLHHYL